MAKQSANIVIAATNKASRVIKDVSRDFAKMRTAVFEVTNTVSSAIHITRAMADAVRALGQAAAVPIKAAIEQERVEKQLQAVLKSTEHAAGLTARQLRNMADELQSVTTFGDEAVIGMQNVLLTFTNIGGAGGIFERTTSTILDMSAALGTDLKNQSIQVGKALNDPIRGVSALAEVGVQFTEQQRELIKELVETNRVAEAQTVILDELQKEFGGSAKAAAETFGGALKQLQNAWGDVLEEMGQFVTQNAGVEAVIRQATTHVSGLVGGLDKAQQSFEGQVQTATLFKTVVLGLLDAIQLLNSAIAAVADGIISLVVTVAEWQGLTLPMTAEQKKLAQSLYQVEAGAESLRREMNQLLGEINGSLRPSEELLKRHGQIRDMWREKQAEAKKLRKAYDEAGLGSMSFGAAAEFANERIGALRDSIAGVNVETAIAADAWTEAAEKMRAGLGDAMSGRSGSTAPLVPEVVPPPEEVEEQTQEAVAAMQRVLEEDSRIYDALVFPLNAALTDTFVDFFSGTESLSDGFKNLTNTLREQMSRALLEPIFGAEGAFDELFKGLLAPIRQAGQSIAQHIFGEVMSSQAAAQAAEIEGMQAVATAQAGIQTAASATMVATTNAATLAIIPSLAAAAALSLVATGGSAGAAALELSAILAAAKGVSLAAAAPTPFAEGGLVTGPTLGLVGEAGPEAILPLSSPTRTRDVLQEALRYLGGPGDRGGGTVVNIGTIVTGGQNPEAEAQLIAEEVDRLLGRRVGRAR